MSQLSQSKITSKDPNFASKQKVLSERVPLEEPVHEVVKSEKKCITATKSELRSNQKFKERMVTSREASAEKYRENSERFPSAFKGVVYTKSTKKVNEAVTEEHEESEKKDRHEDKENIDTNTSSKLKGINIGTASKLYNKGLEISKTGSKQNIECSEIKTNEISSKDKNNSASNSKDNEIENVVEEGDKQDEDSMIEAN